MPPSDALRFCVLGPVEVHRGGDRVSLGGPRQRALLALLLVDPGRVVRADQLVDELWAGEPPDAAEATLRTYISRLRTALGDAGAVTATAAGYVLNSPPEAVDAVAFERRVRLADDEFDRGRYRQTRDGIAHALELWRGRPFGELSDEGRLRVEADRLEQLRLHALEVRLDADLALGRSAAVVDELEALVGRYPHRERLWRTLMLALYHSGRQADALAAFKRARILLDEELGIDPGPELQALERAILRQEVQPISDLPGAGTLPAELTSFVGRAEELEQLDRVMLDARLVTLTGVGGVGKTRLALEAARRRAADAADGAVFADLSTITEQSAVGRVVARAVGVREQLDGHVEQLTSHLRSKEMVLLLDNCEHVVAAAGDIATAVLTACPDVTIIATSRTPLGVPGEVDVGVAPLPLPREGASEAELLGSDAIRLLIDRAAAVSGRGRPADREAHAEPLSLGDALRICRDLDGIPLAIELAAARAKALSLAEIATRLNDRFKFLVSWRRVASSRHQTLRQTMDWSYELLGGAEQSVLAALSVFVGGFELEAAARVCLEGDADAALDAVTRLVDASLVLPGASRLRPSGTRYRMLETVRQYAAARLADSGLTGYVRDRHAAYFAEFAKRAEPELSGGDQTEWFGRLDAEHDNVLAALSHLAATPSAGERLLEMTVALTRFWYVRGYLSEASERLRRAVAATPDAPVAVRRRALTASASVALMQGDYATATGLAEASLVAARTTGEDRLVANGLSNLGAILLAAGDPERAEELLSEAVDLARSVGDTRILALALNNLADHALTLADYQRAEPLFSESLELLRQRGDVANVARSLFNLGAVALRLGRLDDAEVRLRASLAQSIAADDKEDLCWCLVGLAGLAAALSQPQRAARLLGAAVALLEQIGGAFKPFERQLHDETRARARAMMADAEFHAEYGKGTAATLADNLEFAAGS